MDFRTPVKNVLRNCGHAIVSTVHDRLTVMDRMLQDVLDQNAEIAATQTALLQSGIHVTEKLPEFERSRKTDLERLEAEMQELKAALPERVQKTAGQLEAEALAILQSGIDRMQTAVAQNLAVLQPVAYEAKNFLENQSVRQVCVETSDYLSTNPELGLIAFLYSYLPSPIALDIGAHIGDVSAHLLNSGYEVYAFEPYANSYNRLKQRLSECPEFHPFNLALGSVSGEAPMYLVKDSSADRKYEDPSVFHSLARHGMPEDLHFAGTVSVQIRRLSDLHREGMVPADASLVKIDTEGYDLEVIRGMGEYRYPVVLVEFWDSQIPFAAHGLLYTVETMTSEMRKRGYIWYIVIYRVWGQNETAFFCNHNRPVPNSWGNIVFFRDREVFVQAQNWCSAVLPRTYFKHVAAETTESQIKPPPLSGGSA
jgi:FkbM family methyltransferase